MNKRPKELGRRSMHHSPRDKSCPLNEKSLAFARHLSFPLRGRRGEALLLIPRDGIVRWSVAGRCSGSLAAWFSITLRFFSLLQRLDLWEGLRPGLERARKSYFQGLYDDKAESGCPHRVLLLQFYVSVLFPFVWATLRVPGKYFSRHQCSRRRSRWKASTK